MVDGKQSVRGVSRSQPSETRKPDLRAFDDTSSLINGDIQERQEELSKLGAFSTATCTEISRPSEDVVALHYDFPNGKTQTVEYNMSGDMTELKQLMGNQDATMIEDMVGTEHACMYTDDGWTLWKNPSVSEWQVVQFTTSETTVHTISVWVLLAAVLTLLWPVGLMDFDLASFAFMGIWVASASLPIYFALFTLEDVW